MACRFWSLLRDAIASPDVFVSELWCLLELLCGLNGVEESASVETACVYLDRNGGVRLAVNPSFAEEFVKEPADALFLFLHELSHVEKKELLDVVAMIEDPYERFLFNVAADMIINHHLERFLFRREVGFLDRVYAPTHFPHVLLGSMRAMDKRLNGLNFEKLRDFFASHFVPHPGLAAECYLRSCLRTSSVKELMPMLKRLIPRRTELLLLGNHHFDETLGRELPPELKDACKRIRHYSKEGSFLRDFQVTPTLHPYHSSEAGKLVKAIEMALCDGGKPYKSHRAVYPERTVVPSAARLPVFLLAGGATPLFYETTQVGEGIRENGVFLYLDVSGSVIDELPFLYGLLSAIKDELASDRVFLFSTQVEEVTVEEVIKGRVVSDIGTDYNCVVEHARNNRARRILVVTDGYSEISDENHRWLKSAGVSVFVVMVGDDYRESPLVSMAEQVWWFKAGG